MFALRELWNVPRFQCTARSNARRFFQVFPFMTHTTCSLMLLPTSMNDTKTRCDGSGCLCIQYVMYEITIDITSVSIIHTVLRGFMFCLRPTHEHRANACTEVIWLNKLPNDYKMLMANNFANVNSNKVDQGAAREQTVVYKYLKS